MKVGLSTYSLAKAISAGEMDVIQSIQWIADNGGEHVEIVPAGYNLTDNDELISVIVKKAEQVNLDISSYTIGANFIKESDDEYEAEIARVKKEVDIAQALGVKLMRHDAASRPRELTTTEQFEKDFPKVVTACQQIADYAKEYGITTSVENHGFHVQKSERVRHLLKAVDRNNFKTTMDIGNFLCVDENPIVAVKNNIEYASMIHVKDFYARPATENPGEGWFKTLGGNYLRGAIVGHGDIDIRSVLKIIKSSEYSGYLSIEFEGMEDCRTGSKISMDNTRRFLSTASSDNSHTEHQKSAN